MGKEESQEVGSKALVNYAIEGLKDKKGQDIAIIDLREIGNAIADYFVICTGTSDRHVDALADAVEEEVHKNLQSSPWNTEGAHIKEWILIDYVDVVIHIFKEEKRSHYDIEGLWGDGIIINVEQDD